MTQRQIWQHKVSGEQYAVIYVDGLLSEAAGPLHYNEVEAIKDGEYFENDVEIAAELLMHEDDYDLVCEY